ncbi:MAG: hypothetical protein AW09_004194 [Candidatus Accumulibacter phosphatis]|uniref:Uncharacterized protein n=1 Tax=Candidatus Accumulibacter phosphatis TaxID=327160 RepID=A0A080M0E7_9PROT|nr:MAG: hypothetical protein AW09_004194 [Candidatus Accumulibacter phosphatis]
MGGAKGIVDVDVGEPGQRSAEGLDVFRIGLDLGNRAIGAGDGALTLFFEMEAKVFEQDDFTRLDRGAGGLDFRANAIGQELHLASEQPRESGGHRRKTVLRHDLAVGTTKVRHENDGCTMVQSILDRRQGRLDPLGIGDGAGGLVLRDVEIDANQRAFAFEGEIFDEQFGHDFLDSEWVLKKAGCGKKRQAELDGSKAG